MNERMNKNAPFLDAKFTNKTSLHPAISLKNKGLSTRATTLVLARDAFFTEIEKTDEGEQVFTADQAVIIKRETFLS